MSDAVSVRAAEPADVERVVAVAEDAWYAAYGGFLDPAVIAQGLRENYDTELVEAGVEHDEVAFFVAEVEDEAADAADGEVVGFASAEQTWADEVELHTCYVHPDRWGEGVGRALFEEVEAWARERDVDRVVAAVFEENSVGVGFVEALGFERGMAAKGEVGGELHPEIEFEYDL